VDNKVCEFEYAAAGMIGLETVFSVINHLLPNLPMERLTGLLGNNAREIFALQKSIVDKNAIADFTLFERETEYTYQASMIKSKCRNSAFINRVVRGKVIGIINKDKLHLND
jgi:dihydroorotase